MFYGHDIITPLASSHVIGSPSHIVSPASLALTRHQMQVQVTALARSVPTMSQADKCRRGIIDVIVQQKKVIKSGLKSIATETNLFRVISH